MEDYKVYGKKMKTKKLLLFFILFTLLAACVTLVSCYEEQTDKSAELLQIKGAEISNYSAEIIIDSQTSNVNFGEIVSCSDRYQWKLFYEGYAELSNKIAPITNNGDNYFVIKLYYKGAETKHVYTVNVFRNFLVEIRYYDANHNLFYSEEAMTNTPYRVNTSTVPLKDGYEFVGWADYTDKTVTSITPTGYVSLYAKFRPKAYDCTLDVNGGEPLANSVIPVTFGQYYKLPVPAREGYDFVCWEDEHGDAYTDENGNSLRAWSYFFNPQLTARWSAKSYNVTVNCDVRFGSVAGSGDYQFGSQVTVTANNGGNHPWSGWYDGDNLVSTDAEYTFTMPSHNVSLYAKWGEYLFTVIRHDEGETQQTVSTEKHLAGDTVNATRLTREQIVTDFSVTLFVWQGWYEAGRLLTTENVYQTVMPNRSVTVTERWTKLTFETESLQITLTLSDVNPAVGDELTVTATSNGSNALAWYKDGTKLSENPSVTIAVDDKNAKYRLSSDGYQLRVAISNYSQLNFSIKLNGEDKEYVFNDNHSFYLQSGTVTTIIIKCEDMSDYNRIILLWKGWKNKDQLLTTEYEYTFEMPAENVYLYGNVEFGVLSIGSLFPEKLSLPYGLYKYGEQVTLTAPNVNGYEFVGWQYIDNATAESIWLTENNTLIISLIPQNGRYFAEYRKIN